MAKVLVAYGMCGVMFYGLLSQESCVGDSWDHFVPTAVRMRARGLDFKQTICLTAPPASQANYIGSSKHR